MKKFENEYIEFHLEDDILFSYYKQRTVLELDVVKKIADDRLKFTGGKPCKTLVDVSNIKSGSKEAREFLSSKEGGLKGVLAGAFLSERTVSVVLVNLFLKINKPIIPSKFFTKKEDAVAWLKSLKV